MHNKKHGEIQAPCTMWCDCDLDLDSTRIQVDALGHTPTPFWSVKSCHLCFFPGERYLFQIFLDCAYPDSSWSTWSSFETWNLPVWCLLWYPSVWSIRRMWCSRIYYSPK